MPDGVRRILEGMADTPEMIASKAEFVAWLKGVHQPPAPAGARPPTPPRADPLTLARQRLDKSLGARTRAYKEVQRHQRALAGLNAQVLKAKEAAQAALDALHQAALEHQNAYEAYNTASDLAEQPRAPTAMGEMQCTPMDVQDLLDEAVQLGSEPGLGAAAALGGAAASAGVPGVGAAGSAAPVAPATPQFPQAAQASDAGAGATGGLQAAAGWGAEPNAGTGGLVEAGALVDKLRECLTVAIPMDPDEIRKRAAEQLDLLSQIAKRVKVVGSHPAGRALPALTDGPLDARPQSAASADWQAHLQAVQDASSLAAAASEGAVVHAGLTASQPNG